MKDKFNKWTIKLSLLILALFILALIAFPVSGKPEFGITNFEAVHLVSSEPTAVPILMIRNRGNSNSLEIRNSSGTPVASFSKTGAFTGTGNLTSGGVFSNSLNVENIGTVPTILSVPITYTAAAGGSGVVATIADGEIWIVHKVLVRVTTNFDATGDDATLTVGDGNVATGFITLADAALQAADTEGTGFAPGWQGQAAATIGAYLDGNENGFVYAPSGAAETIDYLIDETSGETLTAGAATIYVIYTRIQ